MHLGDRISRALEARGQKPKALQVHLGWAQPSISRLLNGKQRSTIEIEKIATFLDVPVHWLTSGGDTPVPPPSVPEPEGRAIAELREQLRTLGAMVSALASRVQQLEKIGRGRSAKARNDAAIPTADLVRSADLIDPPPDDVTKPGVRTESE